MVHFCERPGVQFVPGLRYSTQKDSRLIRDLRFWTHLLPRFTLAGGRRDTLTAMLPARF
jgi:hypothetical protein